MNDGHRRCLSAGVAHGLRHCFLARPATAGAAPRMRCFRVAEDAERRAILLPAPSAPFRDPALLAAAVIVVPDLHWPALLVGLVGCLKAHWVVLLRQGRRKN